MKKTIYQLKHPVEYSIFGVNGGEPIKLDRLELRRPTAGDMMLIDDYEAKPMVLSIKMIAALSDQSETAIERLDAEDFGPLVELAFANIGAGLKTGATA